MSNGHLRVMIDKKNRSENNNKLKNYKFRYNNFPSELFSITRTLKFTLVFFIFFSLQLKHVSVHTHTLEKFSR